MPKDTVKVCSLAAAEVVKILDDTQPRKLTRPAAIYSSPGLLGITSYKVVAIFSAMLVLTLPMRRKTPTAKRRSRVTFSGS